MEDTRDIAIEARTDIRQIKEMLQHHIDETRQHRNGLQHDIGSIREQVQGHSDLIQQAKGAGTAITAIVATVTTVGLGTIAKFAGIIR